MNPTIISMSVVIESSCRTCQILSI